ncbi:MAG TPA: hypothetical protein DDX19_04855 [Rhodopirellula baltica]|nr:hypothetical protein [Rhodopirellula baltica]
MNGGQQNEKIRLPAENAKEAKNKQIQLNGRSIFSVTHLPFIGSSISGGNEEVKRAAAGIAASQIADHREALLIPIRRRSVH